MKTKMNISGMCFDARGVVLLAQPDNAAEWRPAHTAARTLVEGRMR